jgi:organic radical activating enzyme
VVDGRVFNQRCEINVAEHCNLSCRSCSHLSPVVPKSFADPDVVARDLTALARSYRTHFVRLLGGEPLLHPDLQSVIGAVRASRVGDVVVVVTNGLLLPRMDDAFWGSVDAVEVSVYPGRELRADARARCIDTARRHGVAIRFRACNEFQESYSEKGTDDAGLIERIYTTCNVAHRWRCHNVVNGWFFRCPQAHYIPRVLAEDEDAAHVDGIRIEDDRSFGARLLAYLQSPEPLAACANCLGTAGKYAPHEQVRRVEFRERQRAPTEDLVHPQLVGRTRVALARAEALVPRRVVNRVETTLLSPTFIGAARKAQHATRVVLRERRPAPAPARETPTRP